MVAEPLVEETRVLEKAAEAERDDADLERLRAGDRGAFEDFYRRETGRIYGLCVRLTANRTEGEEITQEVFVRAWQHRESFQSLAHARNWLRTVALNLWRNRLRSRASRGEPLELDPTRVTAAATRSSGLGLDLERAVAELPERARVVLVLHDILGYRHREIAELLAVAVGTSKVQLHRARKRLREVLA